MSLLEVPNQSLKNLEFHPEGFPIIFSQRWHNSQIGGFLVGKNGELCGRSQAAWVCIFFAVQWWQWVPWAASFCSTWSMAGFPQRLVVDWVFFSWEWQVFWKKNNVTSLVTYLQLIFTLSLDREIKKIHSSCGWKDEIHLQWLIMALVKL